MLKTNINIRSDSNKTNFEDFHLSDSRIFIAEQNQKYAYYSTFAGFPQRNHCMILLAAYHIVIIIGIYCLGQIHWVSLKIYVHHHQQKYFLVQAMYAWIVFQIPFA